MSTLTVEHYDIQAALALQLIAELHDIASALYPEDGSSDVVPVLPHEVAAGRGAFLLARLDGEPAACGAVRLLDDGSVEIKRMYTRPTARRHGVAAVVLNALEAEARSLGASRIVLETGPRQPEAIALYHRAGFAVTLPFLDREEHPLSIFMGKDL